MLDVTAAVKSAEELGKAVGIIEKLVGKLKAKPDLAAQKLIQALGEVAKTLQVVDNAASEFLSLGIDDGALAKNSKLLLSIDGGSLSTEVERGRGHCHEIWEIYFKYLDKWFERAFNSEEQASMKAVFQELGNADSDLFYNLEQVAVKLQEEAGVALDLVVKGDATNARMCVLAVLPTLRPLRRVISKTMQTLYSLKSEFVEIAGAV